MHSCIGFFMNISTPWKEVVGSLRKYILLTELVTELVTAAQTYRTTAYLVSTENTASSASL